MNASLYKYPMLQKMNPKRRRKNDNAE